jgi:hypothetical protein
MDIILIPLIFCLSLFLYLHICFHIKTSNDLEVYDVDNLSKDKLEEVCDLKQPVIFNYNDNNIINIFNNTNIKNTYGAFDIKLRDVKKELTDNELLYVNINFNNLMNIFENKNTNKDSSFFTENNLDFLEETGLIKVLKLNDLYLRPYLLLHCNYDVQTGEENAQTPFKYELYYRHYMLVTSGTVRVKLSPPKYKKNLYVNNDYENFEFKSEINPWDVNYQYKSEFDKVKCLEVELTTGQMLYIPPYWFYSIEFGKNSMICNFKYQTYMSSLCILPQLAINVLQNHNIEKKYIKNYKKI